MNHEIDNTREHYEERAAILEFDGGMTREQAENEARRAMVEIYAQELVEQALGSE